MPELFLSESFQTVSTATLGRLGTVTSLSGYPQIASVGRRGGLGLVVRSTTGFQLPLSARTTRAIGFYVKLVDLPNSQDGELVNLMDGGTSQVKLTILPSGNVECRRGATVLGTLSAPLLVGLEYYLEMKATIDNSAGTVEVRLNGNTVLSLTSQDTQASGNALCNAVKWGEGGGGLSNSFHVADFYDADDFLGDVRVDYYPPDADGTHDGQFAPSTGTDAAAMVDEVPPDDDSSYIESETVGHQQTFTIPALGYTPETVHGVTLRCQWKKTDAGARTLAPIVRSGGTDYVGSGVGGSTGYAETRTLYVEDPDTTAAWDQAGIEAAEYGFEVG